jgi:glycogen operon protein
VAAHDGFCLRDHVTNAEKHNEANGEKGADGESHNRSWNCGVEGPTDDEDVLALRSRQQRNFFTTLLLSQGVPMIAHGDELGRTQGGNNNAYCQDNEISWVDWDLGEDQRALLEFARQVVELRHDHPVFRRRRFFAGSPDHGGESDLGDIAWFTPTGEHMSDEHWQNGYARALMVFFNGQAIPEPDPRGNRTVDQSFLVVINGHHESMSFTLPDSDYGDCWKLVLDTARTPSFAGAEPEHHEPLSELVAQSRSIVVLTDCDEPEA